MNDEIRMIWKGYAIIYLRQWNLRRQTAKNHDKTSVRIDSVDSNREPLEYEFGMLPLCQTAQLPILMISNFGEQWKDFILILS